MRIGEIGDVNLFHNFGKVQCTYMAPNICDYGSSTRGYRLKWE